MDKNATLRYGINYLWKRRVPSSYFRQKVIFNIFDFFFLFWPISPFLWSTTWYLFIRTQTYVKEIFHHYVEKYIEIHSNCSWNIHSLKSSYHLEFLAGNGWKYILIWNQLFLKEEGPFFTFPSKSHFRHFWLFFLILAYISLSVIDNIFLFYIDAHNNL